MITDVQKQMIADRLRDEATRLGENGKQDWKALAVTVGTAEATVRYNMQDSAKWVNVSDAKWRDVALKLNVSLADEDWKLAEISNTKMMTRYLREAQEQGVFFCITHDAASGKTAGAELYARKAKDFVVYLKVMEEWSHKRFVQELATSVGVRVESTHTVADLVELIISFFRRRTSQGHPLLILDEAVNLRHQSLRLIKPLYDELQDQMGLVLLGAEDLRTKIQRGVRRNVAGMDQVESRLGRSYRRLPGVTQNDVLAICQANGVTDQAMQARIWGDMRPEKRLVNGAKYASLATEGLRRLKLLIKRAVATSAALPINKPQTAQAA